MTGVLNFAQPAFVLVGARIYSSLTADYHWHVAPAAAVTLLVCPCVGVACEQPVFRFAEKATVAGKVILTLGLFEVIYAIVQWLFAPGLQYAIPIVPPFSVDVLGTDVGVNQLTDVAAAFFVVFAFGAFLRYTRLGLLTRAMAEDRAMTEVFGVAKRTVGSLSWAMAAFSAGIAGILIATNGGYTNDYFLTYFIFAIPATVLAGLRSMLLTAIGGIALGAVTTMVGASGNSYGNLIVFGTLVFVVLTRRNWPAELSRLGWTRPTLRVDPRWSSFACCVFACIAVSTLLALYALSNPVWAETCALSLVFAIAALSVVPILAWTGQISLGQGGLMGIGASAASSMVAAHHVPVPVAILIGMAVGAFFGALLGGVVARLSFVLAAVVTLGFTNVASSFMVGRLAFWVHSTFGLIPIREPWYFASPERQALVFGIGVVVAFGLALSTKRSSFGARFMAAKASPAMAANFGISVSRTRIQAYGLSGALAGLAGALYSFVLGNVNPGYFNSTLSVNVLLYAVVGGVLSLYGPAIGAVLFVGVPQLLGLAHFGVSPWPTLMIGVAIVVISARSPDGLVALCEAPSAHLPRSAIARRVVVRLWSAPIAMLANLPRQAGQP